MKTRNKSLLIIFTTILTITVIVYVAHLPFVNRYMDQVSERAIVEIHAYDKFMPKTSHILPGYLSFFVKSLNKKQNNTLKYDKTLVFNYRRSISKFTYNDKYDIAVYRIDTSSTISFFKNFEQIDMATNRPDGVIFAEDNLGALQIYYNSKFKKKPSLILLQIAGDQTHLCVKNDTVAYFYSQIKNLSLKYDSNGPQDIYISSYDQSIPTEILFLKREKTLILFIMTIKKYDAQISHTLLYDLICK